ncbi:MAG TPA: calcium/sodium antiporter [Candidatus Marinimicrobia bacterium]|nr:calcium/sodium antiporter [Candidatus Neomarinimicrobiota bacterium]
MIVSLAAIILGIALLLWSAELFVVGAGDTARHLGLHPLLIGIIVVGFGTSAPEMLVSALAALEGNPGIALGNAYGSNIANIALILGMTALLKPIPFEKTILRRQLPILTIITLIAAAQIWNGWLSRAEGFLLLFIFAAILIWLSFSAGRENNNANRSPAMTSLKKSFIKLIIGLLLLVLASRVVVWSSVRFAKILGVSDIIIGLTILAVGTSLPELASSLMAMRKGENDLALGNILGSNLFNTLAVVGIAAVLHPLDVEKSLLNRDLLLVFLLTLSLFIIGFGFRGRVGRINRIEGGVLLLVYFGYISWLVKTAISG